MTDDLNVFDHYEGDISSLPPSDPAQDQAKAPQQQQDSGGKESNPFDVYADNSLQPAPPPTIWESFKENFAHSFGGLFEHGAEAVARVRDRNIIENAQKDGVQQPEDSPFSGKPAQAEVDKALGEMAVMQAESARWDSFHSEGAGGKAAAFSGALLGGLFDPTMLLPAARIGQGAKALSEAAGASEVASQLIAHGVEGGVFGAGYDAASQGLDIWSGQQDQFDKQRLLFSTLIGAGGGLTMGGVVAGIKGLRGELPNQVNAQLDGMTEPMRAPAPLVAPEKIGEAPTEAYPAPPKVTPANINGQPFVPPTARFAERPQLGETHVSAPAEQSAPEVAQAAKSAEDAANVISSAPITEQRARIPAFSEQTETAPAAEGGPAGVFMFDPTKLNVDANRFQFKEGGDEQGVTTALRSVSKWDQAKANQIIVWEDKDGQLFVVDGHQRSGLARRLVESGKQQDIQLPGVLYRENDGISDADVRAVAAVKNIAEGSGSALDGAKVLRSRPALMDGSLPLSAGKAKQASNLAHLDDEAFRMVVNDVVPEHQAAIVGELIPQDGPRQNAAMKAIARFEPKNELEATALVQHVSQAELEKANEGAQATMFGDLESAESTAGEEMRIVGKAIADLKKDKSLFSRVVAHSDRIEETGSRIERGAAESAVSDAEIFARRLASDAYAAGALREELKTAAKDLHNGTATLREASERILAALRRQAEDDGRPRLGDRTGGAPSAVERTGAGSPESSTERTPAGQQRLIPGVEPVTDRQRAELAGSNPLTGGAELPPEGGLFDETARNQKELFMRRGVPARATSDVRRSNRSELPGEAATVPGAHIQVTDQEARDLKLNEAMKDIAARIGRRLEMDGRFSTGGVLGTYKPKEGVLRIRYAGDVEVFAHELGHAIDQILSNNPETQAAWRAIRSAKPSELLKMDYNAAVNGGRPTIEEGVAEFIRTFITNPAYAQANAPKTAEAFRSLLADHPDIASIFADTARLSQVESGLNPTQVFSSMIAAGPKFGFEKLSRDFSKYGFVPTIKDYAAHIYGGLIRENVHFDRLTQFLRDKAFEKTGKPAEALTFKTDPDYLFRQLPGAGQSAMGIIDKGVPLDINDPLGSARSPSLTRAIARALNGSFSRLENDTDPLVVDFNAYLVARRALGEWDLFKAGQLRNQPVRASENETKQAIAQFEDRYPQFRQAADDIFAFQRAYLQRKVDKGILSQDTANAFLAKRQDHVPLYRDFGDEKPGAGGGSGGFGSLQFSDVKRFGGSTRDVKNVLRSLVEDVARGERRMAENDVLRAIDDLAQKAGELAGPVWEHVPNTEVRGNTVDIAEALRSIARQQGLSKLETDTMIADLAPMIGEDMTAKVFSRDPTTPRGERILFFYRGGERQAVKVGDNSISRHFYDLMTAMSEPEKDIFLKTLGAVNASFQSAITHAPRFLLGTYVRDNMTRMFIPRFMGITGRVPLAQDLVGLHAMLFDRAFYRAYQEGGGIRGGLYAHASGELSHDALKAAASSSGFMTRTLDELEQANTLGARTAIIAKIPAEFIHNGVDYGASLANRVRHAEGPLAKGWVVLTTPTKMVSDALRVMEMSETASRVGGAKLTYNYLKKQGLSDAEALAGGLFESRDVLNYNSHGAWMRKASRLFPFMQAAITGADRSARGLIAEPAAAAMRAYERGGWANLDAKDQAILSAAWKNWLYIGAMAGVAQAIYYPYAQGTEFYRRASDYMRRTYFLLQTGTDADGNPVGLTIHKGYDIPSSIMTASELYAEEVRRKDPVNWWRVMSGLSESIPRQFRDWKGLLEASPAVKTAYEVATGMSMGMEGQPARPIVPDALKSKPLEEQIGSMTSWAAKRIGAEFGVSPLVVDHVINGMGGTSGQDFRDLATAVFDNNPMTTTSDALNRFFFGQVYRTARSDVESGHDLRDLMARNIGEYQVQARAYRDHLENGEQDEADALYNRADGPTKAFMTLQSSYRFKPEDRDLHPLQRSSDIAGVAYGMMRNLGKSEIIVQDRSHKRGEEREVIQLSPEQARQIHAQLNGILSEETRNGLALVGHPGYSDFSIIDTAPRIDIIRHVSPEAADELQKRLKSAHVLPVQGVAREWPEVESRLLKDGRAARLHDLVSKAKGGL